MLTGEEFVVCLYIGVYIAVKSNFFKKVINIIYHMTVYQNYNVEQTQQIAKYIGYMYTVFKCTE